ncbi:MAG: hypothetical protein U9O85_01500 [Euryarchaeota archaeon]|nr:hypothetical protein [Euryarchaeota archaeon]
MSEEIKEIINIIKEEYPDASEEEIKKAIIDFVNTNLSEIVAKIELPSLKDLRIPSRKEIYRQARSQVKSEKLREDRSKTELVYTLTAIQEKVSDRGLKEDANRFTKRIKDIEEASITKKEALTYVDSDLSEMIKREESAEEDRSGTTRKLEELGEDVNE